MQSSPLSLAYTSSSLSSTSLPLPRNLPPHSSPLSKPSKSPFSYPLDSDLSAEVVIAEDTVGRSSLPTPSPSALALLLSSNEVKGLEDRVKYVHHCLDEVRRARERGGDEASRSPGGPEEELAWAIQSLQTAVREREGKRKALTPHDEYLVTSSVPSPVVVTPPPSIPELTQAHSIVSEDIIPESMSARLLYSAYDGSNRGGYERAHEESLRLRGEMERVEYAKKCLKGVGERVGREREEGAMAEKMAGPEEGKAWEKEQEWEAKEKKGREARVSIRSKL